MEKYLAGEDEATRAGRIVILNKIDGWGRPGPLLTSKPRSAGRSPRRPSCSRSRRRRCSRSPRRRRWSRRSTATTRCHAKPAPGAGGRAVAQAYSREARHRRRCDPVRARALAAGRRAARCAAERHLRAADRAPRAPRQEPDVVEHMMDRVRQEKELFERGLQRFTALRTVLAADERALRRDRPRCATRERRPHAAPDREQPVHEGRPWRDERVLRGDPARFDDAGAGAPRSTT